jgi:hypothetical protein
MKRRIVSALCVLAILVVGIAAVTRGSQKKPAARQVWEYTVLILNTGKGTEESELNRLGAEGWRLVTARQWGNPDEYEYYFERPK